jgi:hypothetical protein
MHAGRAHSEKMDPELVSTLSFYDSLTGGNYLATVTATVESGDLFFNPLNLQAAKGNSLQAAVDYTWQAKLLASATLQANVGGMDRNVHFDPMRLYFLGHSQGAATGPLLASSSAYRAMALSAPSGHLPTNLLGKTKPETGLGIAQLLGYLICDDPAVQLDVHHPFLNLLSYWLEQTDAVNHAPLLQATAQVPRHVFVLSGIDDQYVPREAHNAVISAARLQQIGPSLFGSEGQTLLSQLAPGLGFGVAYDSLGGNKTVSDTPVTGAFRQYHDVGCSDDHFVYSCNAAASQDWLRLFQTDSVGGFPTVP